MRDLGRKSPSLSPREERRRSRRVALYSSGEDSWEEYGRPVRRSELTVPGSRSRSNSHSKSPRRFPDYDYESQRSPRPERLRSSRHRAPSGGQTPILDKFGVSVKEAMERTRYKSRHGSSSSRKSPRIEKLTEDICYISPRRQSPRYSERSNREVPRSPRRESSRYREEPRSPRRESARYREKPRSARRESPRYREESRYKNRYYESTESSEDVRERRRKLTGKYEEVTELELRKVLMEASKPEEDDHDYVNYSPPKAPKSPEECLSPWGPKSPRDRISAMEDVEDTETSDKIINEEVERETKEEIAEPEFTYNIQDIMVQPTESFNIPEIKESVTSPVFEIKENPTKLLHPKEDEKDSCLGLSFSDLNSEHELTRKDDFLTSEEPPAPAPKPWTLFSFSGDGQFQVRDEETGEIFYIYNTQPETELEENDEKEEEEGEEEISWCSVYLCSKIFGLFLMMGGLAAMVVVALQ